MVMTFMVGDPLLTFGFTGAELGEGEPGCAVSIDPTHNILIPSTNASFAIDPPTGNGWGGNEPCPDSISPSLAIAPAITLPFLIILVL